MPEVPEVNSSPERKTPEIPPPLVALNSEIERIKTRYSMGKIDDREQAGKDALSLASFHSMWSRVEFTFDERDLRARQANRPSDTKVRPFEEEVIALKDYGEWDAVVTDLMAEDYERARVKFYAEAQSAKDAAEAIGEEPDEDTQARIDAYNNLANSL